MPLDEGSDIHLTGIGETPQERRLAVAQSKSVMIGTPVARHPVRQYTYSLMQAVVTLAGYGIPAYVQTVVGNSNIARARNEIVAAFLASDYSDLLFIDDDMGWEPGAIIRLLASDKPVIGAVGAKKRIAEDTDLKKWCVRLLYDRPLRQDEFGAIEVEGVGTGFLKIERHVFEAMTAAHPEWKRPGWPDMPAEARAQYHQIFRFPVDGPDELGEDFEFCREWRRLGGEVWADPTIVMTHVGECEFTGDFTAMLQRGAP